MGKDARRLAIYLNDHLAGATAGVELARRLRSRNQADAGFGEPVAEICAEIEADRETLVEVMRSLGISPGVLKPALAWSAEKLGRLKLNGQLSGYSPLSRLVELETLYIGITGKMQMWKTVGSTAGKNLREFDFERLAGRAAAQRQAVEGLHLRAAGFALPSPTQSPSES